MLLSRLRNLLMAGPRGSGRTVALMMACASIGGCFVAGNKQDRDRLRKLVRQQKVPDVPICAIDELGEVGSKIAGPFIFDHCAVETMGHQLIDDCVKLLGERNAEQQKVRDALKLVYDNGGIDGAHHKQWLIDQLVRKLTGTDQSYGAWVMNFKNGDDGPNTYEWDEGIAP